MSSTCPSCKRSFGLFRWRHECANCGGTHCDDCLEGLPRLKCLPRQPYEVGAKWCVVCLEKEIKPIVEAYVAAVEAAEHLETWPRSYKGRVPRDPETSVEEISSAWCLQRDEAEFQVKVVAALLKLNIVYDLHFNKRTGSEASESGKGTHYYTQWCATGTATKRLGSRRGPG